MDAMKTVVFEKLAKAYFEERKSARDCNNNGFHALAIHANHQALGIITAVEALGYSSEEFTEYYRANRPRYRDEVNSPSETMQVVKSVSGIQLVKLTKNAIYEVRNEVTNKVLWNTFDSEKAERMFNQELEDRGETKECDVCHEDKPKSLFYGKDTTCQTCINKAIEEDKNTQKEAWESI
jgi:hypothetical protein